MIKTFIQYDYSEEVRDLIIEKFEVTEKEIEIIHETPDDCFIVIAKDLHPVEELEINALIESYN